MRNNFKVGGSFHNVFDEIIIIIFALIIKWNYIVSCDAFQLLPHRDRAQDYKLKIFRFFFCFHGPLLWCVLVAECARVMVYFFRLRVYKLHCQSIVGCESGWTCCFCCCWDFVSIRNGGVIRQTKKKTGGKTTIY